MQATKVMANLRVADIEAAKSFYADYLGLTNEEFNMGWVARYTPAGRRAVVQFVTPTQKPGNSATRSCIH
jgi:predicted enzyme related to lactoylglutathione lyase